MDVEGLFQLGEHVFVGRVGQLFGVRRDLARAGPQPVDTESPRELGDPGADRLVLAQGVEPLVDPREDLLEDVLGVVLGQPERLDRDRVDVAREPLDQRAPGFLVAAAAKRDELGVAELGGQRCWASRSRFASVSSSFQAMEAFDSTSGRNSQEVRP